ncbi:SMI1/KNR4 family protein [Streptomyces prunicolor]|uniref:SMI1/KNR4 family protein n=1 Tax=Streptomyces prunicolor TaxID=67348 RepID=UPI0034243B70
MTENEQQLLTRVAAEARNTRPSGWTSLPAPVDEATVTRAEAALGFRLPPLLAVLYSRIGDGGFGPEHGLLPLRDNPPTGGPTAVTQYLANRASGHQDPDRPWPEGVADRLRTWLDGTGRYEDDEGAAEPTPWTDFRIRTTAQAS